MQGLNGSSSLSFGIQDPFDQRAFPEVHPFDFQLRLIGYP